MTNKRSIHCLVAHALLVSLVTTLSAQDFYLPLSTKSEVAKTAYYEAMQAASNARIPAYQEQLDKALQADSNFFMAYAHRCMALASFKDYEALGKLTTKALSLKTERLTKAELILRKLLVQWQGDPKSSPAKVMTELVTAYPKNPQAYELAMILAAQISNDKPAALAYAQKLVALRPDYGSPYNTIGYIYLGDEEMDKSKAAFENYIRLSPKEANAHDSMGDYYMAVKDYAKAAEHYDKAVAIGMDASKERAAKAREMMKQ